MRSTLQALRALWLLPLLAHASCGDDTAPGPTIDYELFDITKELDADTAAALTSVSADQSELTFSRSTALLDALAPGEILLAGVTGATPLGLLRKVTEIDRSGPEVRVRTEPTTVFHAFRRLDVELELPLGEEGLRPIPPSPPLGPGAAREALTAAFPIGWDDEPIELFDGDTLSGTTEDRIAGRATLKATVEVHFWLHFDWELKSPEEAAAALGDLLEDIGGIFTGGGPPSLAEVLNLRTGISFEGDFEAALGLEGRSALHYEKEIPLGYIPLGVVPIGPLIFTPYVSLDASFSGAVSGQMTMGFEVGARAKLGFAYDADEGWPTPIVSGPTFTREATSPVVTASARVHGELDLSLHFPLYGFFGPHVSLVATLDADVDRERDPCFQLRAGLEGRSGASLGFAGTSLLNIAGPSIDLGDPLQLASGVCAPLPDPPVTDTLITPWSQSYAGTVWSASIDDGSTTLTVGHDHRLLLTSSAALSLLKVEEDGTLVWARRFDQPERPGLTELWPNLAVPTVDAGILVSMQQGVLVKLSAGGDGEWAVQLESDNAEEGAFWTSALVGQDTWLAGTYRRYAETEAQALVLILGPDGSPKTAWTWGQGDRQEVVRHILPVEDGALLLGHARLPGSTRSFVMEVGADGTIRWARHLESCAGEEPVFATAIRTHDGDFILGGWHYATDTRAILMRIPRDGSGAAPQWATETSIPEILGLQIRSIHQLATGELRVVGRWARASPRDEVFVGATDSIGRFAWARWYGEDGREEGPPTSVITSQGGLLVASSIEPLGAEPGGHWLFEVPSPNGEITFAPGSGAATAPLVPSSSPTCVSLVEAPAGTTPFPLAMTSVQVDVLPEAPAVAPR